MRTEYLAGVYDALGHGPDETGQWFNTLEEAQAYYDECLAEGGEDYDLAIELEKVTYDGELFDDSTEYTTISDHEWFTEEEWAAVHPDLVN